MKKLCRIAWIIPLLVSCTQHSVSSAKQFSAWINDESNGCKVSKEVNGMILEVKYLPPAFIALKDLETSQSPRVTFDSLYNSYQYSTTFLLTFKPKDQEKGPDVMYKDVPDYKAYVERSMTLNFDLESKLMLKTDKDEYKPVLSSLENTYGLSKGRSVYMVFTAKARKEELDQAAFYDLVYTDDIYDLGILHFMFDYRSIKKHLPEVNIHHS